MSKRPCGVLVSLLVLAVGLCLMSCAEEEVLTDPIEPRYPVGSIPDPGKTFASITPTLVTITPKAATYTLPLDRKLVVNLDRDVLKKGFSLSTDALSFLDKNGLVALAGNLDRFTQAYELLKGSEVPTVVTSDSVLHLYHVFFSQLLKYIEVKEFVPMLRVMTAELARVALRQYAGAPAALQEAARRNVAYFSVAARLLDDHFQVSPLVAGTVNQELALIGQHKGFFGSPIFDTCPHDPCKCPQKPCALPEWGCFCEDYSQYVPRGHYTQSEDLKRYFKAMMWLGRIGMRIQNDTETQQAVLATAALKLAQPSFRGKKVKAADLWLRIYRVTGFFVGTADDLTYYEYDKAVTTLFQERFDEGILAQADKLASLKKELAKLRKPKIMSGFVMYFQDFTKTTQGLRFMGQRFVPDSYVLGQSVFAHVGPDLNHKGFAGYAAACKISTPTCAAMSKEDWDCICTKGIADAHPEVCRVLPKGFDVMSAMGSGQADVELKPDQGYCSLPQQEAKLKKEFAAYTAADWDQNMYWKWLDVLRPLLAQPGTGWPVWMQTEAYHAKALNTALASWAQLRHDTILYVKQSYTHGMDAGSAPPPPPKFFGYVEPLPHLYAKLHDLAQLTLAGLTTLKSAPDGLESPIKSLASLMLRLKSISEKELTNQDLSGDDLHYIKYMGSTMTSIIQQLAKVVVQQTQAPTDGYYGVDEQLLGDGLKTTIAADVHTDGNTKRVLEEAVGKVDWIVLVHKLKDGTLGAAVGPIFSYYEFPHPMKDRLTDAAWRTLLNSKPPARPVFTKKFLR